MVFLLNRGAYHLRWDKLQRLSCTYRTGVIRGPTPRFIRLAGLYRDDDCAGSVDKVLGIAA